jgi:hypothetical protein
MKKPNYPGFVEVFDGERGNYRSISFELNRCVEIRQCFSARSPVNPDPGLDSSPSSVDLPYFVDLNFDQALSLFVVDPIPFTGRADAENYISAVTILRDMPNDPSLLTANDPSGIIERGNDGNVQSLFQIVVHNFVRYFRLFRNLSSLSFP